ncbi:MAG: hypothetical protein PHU11_01930 [Dysgonamonadaceae bacterium]|nr:hypothetical protein [Dysgonamonadaceae bacterium]MDD3494637.1 hypothetical protein [Dysgonamonadaceae bacterium]
MFAQDKTSLSLRRYCDVGPATYCLHKAEQAVTYTTKVRKNSARFDADSCLTHFPKSGCKARKPCGRISANMLAVELPLWLDIDNMFVVKLPLRLIIGNVLAVGLTLRLDIGNMFVVKPTLRSNNDNVLSA